MLISFALQLSSFSSALIHVDSRLNTKLVLTLCRTEMIFFSDKRFELNLEVFELLKKIDLDSKLNKLNFRFQDLKLSSYNCISPVV